MEKILFKLVIIVIIAFIIFQCFEYNIKEGFINEIETKEQLLTIINNKLLTANNKLSELEKIKPLKPSALTDMFKKLPDIMKTERDSNYHYNLQNINENIQNKRINNITKSLSDIKTNINETINAKEGEIVNVTNNIKSLKSHQYGKTLNLMKNGDGYSIIVNSGCLYMLSNGDYGITDISLSPPNKICQNVDDQKFIIKTINNLEEYKKEVKNKLLDQPIDTVQYPFSLVKPVTNPNLSLTVNYDSVHFEPVNFKISQRWQPNNSNAKC